MTAMEPSKARAFWFALVDNAARLVVDADTLGPSSPRAQSLVVLALEELGKAHWVAQIFWRSWSLGDEVPLDVPYLDEFGASHRQKLMQATHYIDGADEFVSELRLFRSRVEVDLRPGTGASDPRQYVDYLESWADADNKAKQRGFYVDIGEHGALLVPHEMDRPGLADDIWGAADAVKSMLVDQALGGDHDPRLDSIDGLIAPILERYGPFLKTEQTGPGAGMSQTDSWM
jgi:AbiV family abortive infection protein